MTPKPPPSVLPAPPNYAVPEFNFPNAIPGKQPPHSDFVLWPEVTPKAFPVTPPIPPTVQTGDVITAAHENTVSTAIEDLWIDLQSLASTTVTDPTQATGDLIVREGAALGRLPIGATGTLLLADTGQPKGMRWATLASTGAVPSSRQVLAGLGMTGGGPLTGDVTLNAKVTSVNGQIGAVALTAADISGAVPATRSITPADATLIGGGDLSADRTFRVAPDTSIQRIRYSKDGALVGTRPEVNLVPGANVTISVTDDAPNNRININVAAAGGGSGGMVDPTVNPGDLIVRGTSTTTNLPVGTSGQVLTVDTTTGLKMKWAAPAGGVPTSRRINTTGPALTGGGDLTGDLTLAVAADTIVQKTRVSNNGVLIGTRQETNFIPGSNVSLTMADDAANNRVNITINSTAVGGAQTPWTSDIDAAGFTLKSAGKIGIGIALPQSPLHIVTASVTGATIETTAASAGTSVLNLKTPTSFWQMGAGGAGSSFDGCWYVYSQTGAVNGLVINASGYVGVGMTGSNKPLSQFQVGVGFPLAAGIADFYGPNRATANSGLVNILTTDAMAVDKGGMLGLGGVGGSPSPFPFALLSGRSEGNNYAGYFQICTNNSAGTITEWMRVTSAGNVGIGTPNPGVALDVRGGVDLSNTARIWRDGHDNHYKFMTTDGTTLQLSYSGNATPIMTATYNGNVGIGTTNPQASLHITRPDGNYELKLENAGFPRVYGIAVTGSGGLTFDDVTVGGIRLFISSNSNVGIGNAGPAYKLDVSGDINSSGEVRQGGTPIRISTRDAAPAVLDTTYQNSTGRPMFVSVYSIMNAGAYTKLLTDAGNPPARAVSAWTASTTSGGGGSVSGWVMAGHFYRVESGGGGATLQTWTQWY